MLIGTAAFSTGIALGQWWDMVSIVPLVVAVVSLASSWVAAFFWMCQDDDLSGSRD
jgi:hypothetical protein